MPTLQQRLIRACIYPILLLCNWGFPPCPKCHSINGWISGYSGANDKTHGYPDYAPPANKHHVCMECFHEWTRPYHQKPDWYYPIRRLPARFISHQTYHKILDKIDYSIKGAHS